MNQIAALTASSEKAPTAPRYPVARPQPAVPVPVTVSASEAYLDTILRAARDPSVDIGKMKELMQMRKELRDEQAEIEFNTAMRDCQRALPRIWRNKAGDGHQRYADLEAIDVRSRPIITEHGFGESYGTADSPLKDHYRVTCLLSHTGGHTRLYHADVPTDMFGPKGAAVKTAIHGFGSAMSYGRRYLKCLIFNIVLTKEDDDGKSVGAEPTIDADQVETLRAKITATKSNLQAFLDLAGAKTLEEIPAAKYESLNAKLEKKAQRGQQ